MCTCAKSANQLPNEVESALRQSQLNEGNMISGPRGARATLMDYMAENWRMVLDHLFEIAPGRAQRLVIYRACDGLDPVEFLDFLERIVSLNKEGVIKDEEYVQAIYFSSYKTGFLDLNINNERVQAIVRNTEDVYSRMNISFEKFSPDKIKEIEQRGAELALLERPSLGAIKLPKEANDGKHADMEEGGKAGAQRSKRSQLARPESGNSDSPRIWAFVVAIFLIAAGWLFFRFRRSPS